MNINQFWKEKIKLIPEKTQKQFITEFYKNIEKFELDKQDQCWRLIYHNGFGIIYLDEPPEWFILKAWQYLEENKNE